MARLENTVVRSEARGIEMNKVLRNTYTLLAATLLWSAAAAGVAMMFNIPRLGIIPMLVGMFGLLFLTNKFRNSALGLLFVFLFTGFMGLMLGPIINLYVNVIPNGSQLVMTALGGTGSIFVGLSAYVLVTQKNFRFIGGMLFVGILVAVLALVASYFFAMPALSLAVSAMIILLMSGMILYETSEIIHGGETNYITATVSLYLSIYNIFSHLLMILGVFGGDD